MGAQALVEEFHEAYGFPVHHEPMIEDEAFRLELIVEEVGELACAVRKRDVTAVVDALADLAYVVYGSALTFGIDLDKAIAEVHRSNMTKNTTHSTTGKPAKGSGFEQPDPHLMVVAWDGRG